MVTIKFTNYIKFKNGQIGKQTEFFNVNEVINPKTFLEEIANDIDIYRFSDENEVFQDILLECVDLFLTGFRIDKWDEETKDLDQNQQAFFLLDTITNKDAKVLDIRNSLTQKEAKTINRISKVVTANFNILMKDLIYQKQQHAKVLNTAPEKTLFDFSTQKLLEIDKKQEILINAFNKSRECYCIPKPKISIFSKEDSSSPRTPKF